MITKTRCGWLLPLLMVAQFAQAEIDPRLVDGEMYPDNVRYNSAIATPESILGFELGAEPVRHHKLVEYIQTIGEQSDRLTVEIAGYTHERRPILFVTATSPRNHARLDDIRARHQRLSNGDTGASVGDDMPVVTWLNYGVHGAESSGMDASLPFLYYLAAAESDALDRILDNSVVLVTAIFNPDGHSKRVAWFDAWGGVRRIADPAHFEHQFNWQYARTNHYGFDLNRQWLLLTQPEARAWMRKWHEWRPNLTVDYHEMGSAQTYYFHPGVRTRTNPLVPDAAEQLLEETVKSSERFLDSEGRLYFHGEAFDNYYVGKGSTFPLINGGVGVLYEAAAALGREIETGNGLRTYRENIRKHFRTSIASIEAASAMRQEYLDYQRDFYRAAINDGARASNRAWVFAAPDDPARLHMFAELLKFHRINSYRLARSVTVDGVEFSSEDALIVPAAQAQHRLIRSIFETVSEFEDATFYDVSTWTLPPAFGLQYAALGNAYRDNLLGTAHDASLPTYTAPPRSAIGYVFSWHPYYAPRALQRLLETGAMARVATKPFTVTTDTGTTQYPAGSVVVASDRQTVDMETVYDTLATIGAEDGIEVRSLVSGLSSTGTAGIDVGGPSFKVVRKPEILLVTGDSMNLYDAGEIWHLLDYRMNVPVTLRDRDTLAGIDWNRYTHILFPAGGFEDYLADYEGRLRQWIQEGGTAVAFRNAAPWLQQVTLDWVDPALAPSDGTPVDEDAEDLAEDGERLSYAEKDAYEAEDLIGGAIFAADLDTTHPLGFGFGQRELYLHKNFKAPFAARENPFATVVAYAEDEPVYSGYVSEENRQELAGTPALIAERYGAGSVILFADNPNFRGYWYGTNKLTLNAIYFSRLFDPVFEQ